jgi:hypothetical protein
MSVRKLLPVALLLAVISIRCAGSPAEPIGTVSLTQTTTTTTSTVIPAVVPGTPTASPAGTGLAGATVFTFSTQPSGGVPPYTVQWLFGDGGAGSGLTAQHVFATPGTFTATATVSDSRPVAATTTPTTTVNVRTVTGTWFITFDRSSSLPLPARESMDLVQNGAAVTATINDTTNGPAGGLGLGIGSGTVSNPRSLSVNATFANATPPFAATLIGTVDSTVTQWTGQASGYPTCPCTFTALRSSAPGVLSVPTR